MQSFSSALLRSTLSDNQLLLPPFQRRKITNMNYGQQSNDSLHDDESALAEFLASLTDYTPTIPDELVEHYISMSGFQCPDVRLIRLVAVAAQKFIAEIAADALQHCKARQSAVIRDKKDKQQQQKERQLTLTMEDLSKALREYGVNLKHQEYFADSPSTGMVDLDRKDDLADAMGHDGLPNSQ
ncbi:Transcription initiation factor TFIID subunit 10 [Ancistrocladus abbreviatus]